MQQGELFRLESTPGFGIPGFSMRHNYITPSEEADLLREIESGPWQTDYRRRVQQYGLGYQPAGGPVWLRDFPEWLVPLARRVANDAGFDRFPENCVINEYLPPQGIGLHRDYPDFGGIVACISLGSDIVMDFADSERGLKVPVHVPARSFWTISGEARSRWQHGIAARLTDVIHGERQLRSRRVSVTFRTARNRARIRPRPKGAFRTTGSVEATRP